MTILKLRRPSFAIVAILLVAIATGWFSSVDVAATVTPPSVSVTLDPGGSTSLTKTVTTPTIPPNPDIAFLADTTGSMGPEIANVQANAGSVLTAILTAQPTAQFSVSEYRDISDAFRFKVNQSLTGSSAAVQTAINGWSAGGGGDRPEAQLPALKDLANGTAGWRTGSTRIVVWFGDEPGHDPRAGVSETAATNALISAGVQVVAVNVRRLDETGQATRITNATGGSLQSSASGVAAAILAGLQNLPVTVTPSVSCGSGASVSLSPSSITTTSGNTVSFTETITASGGAAEGSTITCTVDFQTPGGSIGTQTVTVHIPDRTPPVLTLPPDQDNEATDANGTVHDFSGDISATDNVDPNPTITCNNPSGWLFPVGDTVVTCTATDASGNSTTGSFTKSVSDTTPPVLTMPPDATNEATGPDGAVHTFTATARDTVDPNPTVVCDPPSGTTFPLGDTTITCTATDSSGNSVSDTFVKTVEDTTPPDASCDPTVNPHGEKVPNAGEKSPGQNEDGFYALSASDLVDLDPAMDINGFTVSDGDNVQITQAPGVTPSQTEMGSGKGQAGAIASHLILSADATLTVTDFSGNSTTVTCLVPPPPK